MKLLFFGLIAKMGKLRGKPAPSSVLRCTCLANELDRMGFECKVRYVTIEEFKHNLQEAMSSDVVVFHRLQAPITTRPEPLTEVFLHLAAKSAGALTVFDLDDAIFLQQPLLTELFCARSHIVTVVSHQLERYALKWNRQVEVVPSPVDTVIFNPEIRRRKENKTLVLGWHGTAYVQLDNLRLIIPILADLAKKYDLTLKLLGTMGDRRIQNLFKSIPNLRLDFGPEDWIPYEHLPEAIANVDIGVSPLRDSLWSRCKGAIKALEYMSMGIPVVASPVGEHNYIIRNGQNGFLANSNDDWFSKIEALIKDSRMRHGIGANARQTVVERYSLSAVSRRFADLARRNRL